MKKLIANLLMLAFVVSLYSCASEKSTDTEESKSSSVQDSKPTDASNVDDEDETKEKSEEEQKSKESAEGSDDMSLKSSKSTNTSENSNSGEQNAPIITFDEKFFDFGKRKEGEQLLHTFVFKNTGKAPLKIQTVKTSCNCSHLKWTKDKSYAPGDTGHINLRFDSKDKSGTQQKSFSIIANTEPKRTDIRFSAEIEK